MSSNLSLVINGQTEASKIPQSYNYTTPIEWFVVVNGAGFKLQRATGKTGYKLNGGASFGGNPGFESTGADDVNFSFNVNSLFVGEQAEAFQKYMVDNNGKPIEVEVLAFAGDDQVYAVSANGDVSVHPQYPTTDAIQLVNCTLVAGGVGTNKVTFHKTAA